MEIQFRASIQFRGNSISPSFISSNPKTFISFSSQPLTHLSILTFGWHERPSTRGGRSFRQSSSPPNRLAATGSARFPTGMSTSFLYLSPSAASQYFLWSGNLVGSDSDTSRLSTVLVTFTTFAGTFRHPPSRHLVLTLSPRRSSNFEDK